MSELSKSGIKAFYDTLSERERNQIDKDKREREAHKCNTCVYAQWLSDKKVVCPFVRCIKE